MIYDSIVVGAGPAGLSASIYLRRAGKTVLVLDANHYGGDITKAHRVENYPGFDSITGPLLADKMYKQAESLGAEFKLERVLSITPDKTVVTEKDSYKGKSIIIATGRVRSFELDKDDYYLGKGLSYCATCDGAFFKNKTVAVIGDGASAIEDAKYLSNICAKVYLIGNVDSVNNVEVINAKAVKINGDELIESIDLEKDGNITKLEVNGLFVANGQTPNNMFSEIVDIKENGYFDNKLFPRTKTKGIYIAGDCVDKELRQVVTAVSDGATAATAAIREMED